MRSAWQVAFYSWLVRGMRRCKVWLEGGAGGEQESCYFHVKVVIFKYKLGKLILSLKVLVFSFSQVVIFKWRVVISISEGCYLQIRT